MYYAKILVARTGEHEVSGKTRDACLSKLEKKLNIHLTYQPATGRIYCYDSSPHPCGIIAMSLWELNLALDEYTLTPI